MQKIKGGREVGGGNFVLQKIGMGMEGWLKFYLILRMTEYSFGFKAMNSLIGFPLVSSLNFSTTSCWYPRTRNGLHRNLKSRNQLLFSPKLGKRHQFLWHK